jgi:hypothetical protein
MLQGIDWELTFAEGWYARRGCRLGDAPDFVEVGEAAIAGADLAEPGNIAQGLPLPAA